MTFGEAMLRFSPPNFQRVEQATSFEMTVGGAELNTAIALARLGHEVAWVSALPENPLGRIVANQARQWGVDTSGIRWTADGRVGLYFLEFGAAPRPSSIVYDRADSSMARVKPGQFDWPTLLTGADWLHISGITPALSAGTRAATFEAVEAARTAGIRVSLDPNYRAKLWSLDEAAACLRKLLPHCDLLISTAEDVDKLFGVHGSDGPALAAEVSARFGISSVTFTLRESLGVLKNRWSALLHHAGQHYQAREYEVEIIDRVGAGDAFAAGLIDGLLANDPKRGLDWGVAMGALKHSIPGDFALVTRAEVAAVAAGGSLRISR